MDSIRVFMVSQQKVKDNSSKITANLLGKPLSGLTASYEKNCCTPVGYNL